MKSVSLTNKKRSPISSREKTVSRLQLAHTFKSVSRQTSKQSSPLLRKMKRSLKQGLRSMLLSPFFHKAFTFLCITLVVGITLYSSYRFIGKTFANEVIVSQSEIIARAGKLTPLPQEEPDKIVRVQDPEDLRQQNAFYKDIEEGDYILMYKNVAVIYRFRDNMIIAIKRLENTPQTQGN